jgi:hypothetical protein
VWLGGYQTAGGFPDTGMTGNRFEHNIVYSPGGWANLLWWAQNKGDAPPTVQDNDYYSATGTSMSSYGYTDSNTFFDDPFFSDPSANNYTVGATSSVHGDIGWVTLPTGQGLLPYAP